MVWGALLIFVRKNIDMMKLDRYHFKAYFLLAAVFVILGLSFGCNKAQQPDKKPYLVVLSLDGFRWDYPQHFSTPNLNMMAKEGVHANSLIPCFPTKTFPNHYSIATGLYPDHHGIIQNSFYVPGIGTFEPTNRQSIMNGAYYEGEPIWLTAENQGMKSACCFWVGSEAPIKGKYPSIWLPYNQDLPFTSRIDSVITWLQLPSEKRPHLIMWYIHQPDEISHHEGPLAASTGKMISYLDSLVGVFRARLNELPIANKVNFVVVSDHGMAKVNENNNLYLDHLVPRYWINMACGGDIQLNITATPGYKDSLYHRLKKVNHLSVWKKEEVPQRLHYGTNPRIYDLVVLADTGWNIMLTQPAKIIPGHHGYDNIYPDMHGIFYAVGPAFKNGYERPSFENIHLYPLFTHILKLKPAEVDGRLEEVRDMLKN